MAISMISLQAHLYAGKRLKSGEQFECRGESDARVLRALGRAMDYTPPPALPSKSEPAKPYKPSGEYVMPEPAKTTYSTAAIAAGAPSYGPGGLVEGPKVETSDDPEAPRQKRAYRRRDLKAEK